MEVDICDINYNIMKPISESPIPFPREGTPLVHYCLMEDSDVSDFDEESDFSETKEGRLSRSLQTWMPDHEIVSLDPKERPPVEPVFSGRLGKERDETKHRRNNGKENSRNVSRASLLRRADSNESIETNISLLTCSSCDTKEQIVAEPNAVLTKRRRKRMVSSRASTLTTVDSVFVSKWVELASKSKGIFDKFMRIGKGKKRYVGNVDISEESEAFLLFDQDEQILVFNAGSTTGIRLVQTSDSVQRSGSASDLSNTDIDMGLSKPKRKPLRRVASTSSKSSRCKLDLAEFKRQMLERRIAEEQARFAEKEKQRKGKRGSLTRNLSRGSLSINLSTSSRPVSPTSASGLSQSVQGSDQRPFSSSGSVSSHESSDEKQVTVWKGDREILEIDLKKELTARVKKKIASTRTALSRVSGLGDDNELRTIVGVHEEFPKHTEEDFSHKPRIIQRMRISPHLSGVIHEDIKVRMGRPRYHAIKIEDLELWNKGQNLDRAHRNLKVFNWLHSLRESQFIKNVIADVKDELSDVVDDIEVLHIEAADEPDLKPLYKAYEVRIL